MGANAARSFYLPQHDLTPKVISDVLLMMGEHVEPSRIETWAEMERVVVYDWAIREHLTASDNIVARRERPAGLLGPARTS
jgi:hypothetical protein